MMGLLSMRIIKLTHHEETCRKLFDNTFGYALLSMQIIILRGSSAVIMKKHKEFYPHDILEFSTSFRTTFVANNYELIKKIKRMKLNFYYIYYLFIPIWHEEYFDLLLFRRRQMQYNSVYCLSDSKTYTNLLLILIFYYLSMHYLFIPIWHEE